MGAFNYDAEAELFPSKSRSARRLPVGHRRFASAAGAIRFAIEDLSAASLVGTWLEVGDDQFDAREIRRLYEHADFPLQRREAADRPIATLDQHRGMASQKATELRRLQTEFKVNQKALRDKQAELETRLAAAPAASWHQAADKARYLLELFAATPIAKDPRRQFLIANVLEDFARLSQSKGTGNKRTMAAAPSNDDEPPKET